jgi:hypothetical protein
MRALVKEANGETVVCPGQDGGYNALGPKSEGFREDALSGLIALVEAMQDRAHE